MHKVGQLGLLRSRRLQLDGPSLQRLGVFRPTSSPSLIVDSPGCLRWRNGGPHEPRRSVAKFSRRHQKKEEENQKENVHERTQIEPHSKEILNFAEWRLTVGLEIHAQLNTARKLFSEAKTSPDAEPNTNVVPYDLAYPGTQPHFQKATLIPAIRAALALNCRINLECTFDRKHYFYHDQPAGYQITQFYAPYAQHGYVPLTAFDGDEYTRNIRIKLKQIQMEQDTAKSTIQDGTTTLLDFNRVGHPLIEIITEPVIHSSKDAVACVRKIQSILQSVNAVTTGMEMGGLRADINVSVVPMTAPIEQLGQRVEIKNLSTLQSIEAAIKAEMKRQIEELSAGRRIEGETRAWSLGSTETRRLRGKEGEVDYRYMPDPDIPPLFIGQDLVNHLRDTLPQSPDQVVGNLRSRWGLTLKDAKTLVALDDGQRLEYFDEVIDAIDAQHSISYKAYRAWGREVGNWVIHDIGRLLASTDPPIPFSPSLVPSSSLARLLVALHSADVSRTAAKLVLQKIFNDIKKQEDIESMLERIKGDTTTKQVYNKLADSIIERHEVEVRIIKQGKMGKLMFLIGQMMKEGGKAKIDPQIAEQTLREKLGLPPKAK